MQLSPFASAHCLAAKEIVSQVVVLLQTEADCPPGVHYILLHYLPSTFKCRAASPHHDAASTMLHGGDVQCLVSANKQDFIVNGLPFFFFLFFLISPWLWRHIFALIRWWCTPPYYILKIKSTSLHKEKVVIIIKLIWKTVLRVYPCSLGRFSPVTFAAFFLT